MNLWTLTPSLALKKGVNSSPARCSPRKFCLVVGGQPAPRTCSQGLLCPSGSSCSGPGRWSTTKRKNAANPGRGKPRAFSHTKRQCSIMRTEAATGSAWMILRKMSAWSKTSEFLLAYCIFQEPVSMSSIRNQTLFDSSPCQVSRSFWNLQPLASCRSPAPPCR